MQHSSRSPQDATELERLCELSARLGRDPLLVQGSTGNTSIKIGDTLWIKGSGKWLIDAKLPNFWASVELSRALRCVDLNIPFTQPEPPDRSVSASIETAMHAVVPDRIVVHVHSIQTIAWAVQQDAAVLLQDRLQGLPWQWIPYVSSGTALAHVMRQALKRNPDAKVFVLGNHGLVVAGESCAFAEELLFEVEQRLFVSPRPLPQALTPPAATPAAVRHGVDRDVIQVLGTDLTAQQILAGGFLYPCQAIFLSATVPVSGQGGESGGKPPSFVIHPGRGVTVDPEITRGELELLVGLAQIIRRLPSDAKLRYLTDSEVGGLGSSAQQYRQLAEESCRTLSGCA